MSIALQNTSHGEISEAEYSTALDRLGDLLARARRGMVPVAPATVTAGFRWVSRLFDDVTERHRFITPNVTYSDGGELVFEWWQGTKKLTVYLNSDGNAEYVKVWGPDVFTDMEDGAADTALSRAALWEWLCA